MNHNIIDIDSLIHSKNKSSIRWKKHNFLFEKFSEIVEKKLYELGNNYKNILLLSSDLDETFKKIIKLDFQFLIFLSPYKHLIKKIDCANPNILKVEGLFEEIPCKNKKFDLIVSNFCLHNINDKEKHLSKLYNLLEKDGLLICNFVGEKTLNELKNSLIKTDDYIFNGIFMRSAPTLRMLDISDLSSKIGFKELVSEKITFKIYYDNVHKLLFDIKGVGENIKLKNTKKGLLTKNYLSILNNFYKNNFSDENGIRATCDIISISGWKNKV
jgi:SAM-dependent methyltransferase